MKRLPLERKILSENDRIAAGLRARFQEHGIVCLNLLGSPGAGKTALLERTLQRLPPLSRVAVLTGDLQTDNDARRLGLFGFPTRQITTGGTCHLEAHMVDRALADWDLGALDLLLIENVGNLVCPASYDLGEEAKIVVMSVTEGDDKPLKYPGMFFRAELLVINKVDLAPYVPFDIERAKQNALQVQPSVEFLETSCISGEGIDAWIAWLERRIPRKT